MLTDTWHKANEALNHLADAIRDQAQSKPVRHSLAEAKELFAKVNLEIAQTLSNRELK